MQFFPSNGWVNSITKMLNKCIEKKARREWHKNATSHIEQMLEAIFYVTAFVRPPTTYL